MTKIRYAGRTCAGTCERVLRSRTCPADLAPATAVHYANGLCSGCHGRAQRTVPELHATARIHKADLDVWLEGRRRRNIPEHGLLSARLGIAS
jgi:hypothetical protein